MPIVKAEAMILKPFISVPSLSSYDIESNTVVKHKEREGLLLLSYESANGEKTNATVCSPNFGFYLADHFCSKIGYKYGDFEQTGDIAQFITQQ